MEVIFKAKDGKMFDSAEACVQYEAELVDKAKDWTAWTWSGLFTDDTSEALIVKLNGEDAAAQFLAKARLDDDDNVDGIEVGDEGWFFYDDNRDGYTHIDGAIIHILKTISAS